MFIQYFICALYANFNFFFFIKLKTEKSRTAFEMPIGYRKMLITSINDQHILLGF